LRLPAVVTTVFEVMPERAKNTSKSKIAVVARTKAAC